MVPDFAKLGAGMNCLGPCVCGRTGNYQDDRAADGFVDPSPGLQGEGILSGLFERETRTVVVLDEVSHATSSPRHRHVIATRH